MAKRKLSLLICYLYKNNVVSRATWHRMVGQLMNNKRERYGKE
jgi:hypothetical protein